MRRFLGVLLLTVGVLQLGFRGMQRFRNDTPLWDFASVYSASRNWIHGGNPYDLPAVVSIWRATGIFTDRDASNWATVYPPTSLVTLVPVALLPGAAALTVWLAITVALLILQFMSLVDLAGLRWRDPRVLILIGASLAAAPMQFGILSGQLSLPAISLCVIAFWCAANHREKLAGVLLGLACAVKPQVAGAFVIFYLILRRRVVSEFAIMTGAALCVIALAAMRVTHIDWIAGWTHSIAVSSQVGGVNDYGSAGMFRDEIMDLKMLLVSIPHDPIVLRIVIECIVAALIAWYVYCFPRGDQQKTKRTELLALAGLSAISLLPLYHRVYDAALLTTALAWALAELDGVRRRHALALLIPMTAFLIPFDFVKSAGYRVPGLFEISHTWWWQSFFAPHYAWGLFALTLGLLFTMSSQAVARPVTEEASEGVFATESDDDEDMLLAN